MRSAADAADGGIQYTAGRMLLVVVLASTALLIDRASAEANAASVQVNTASVQGGAGGHDAPRTLTDRSLSWPTFRQWRRLLLLQDYNTRVVVLATTLLGCAAGLVGTFTLLRKRALMGDALSHATLPGIALAFIIATAWGKDGKSLPILLLGAGVTGLLGVGVILLLRNMTRLKEDTALGAVLSVFFGAGMALLGVIQQMREGHAAGLESFIYGKTASMGYHDAMLISSVALICTIACVLLFKEFKVLCFDEAFTGSCGFPVVRLDMALMALVVMVCIVGLQAVGLILMIALLVIPAAAARFWTEKMWGMALISGGLGAAGGMVGAGASAVFSDFPSGATIVLVCSACFFFSMMFGKERGLWVRTRRRLRLNRTVSHQHLLRAIYETLEASARSEHQRSEITRGQLGVATAVSFSDLLPKRSWSPKQLRRTISRAQRAELVQCQGDRLILTQRGLDEATRLTREHRLWELYLMTHADIAPGQVDRDADAIEHVLAPEVIAELERLLKRAPESVPSSPHALSATASDTAASSTRGK